MTVEDATATGSNGGPLDRLREVLKRYRVAVSVSMFLIGIVLLLISRKNQGLIWELTGSLGIFLAAAVAIPFYYELVLRDQERRLVRDEVSKLLEEKLAPLRKPDGSVVVHDSGRLTVAEKATALREATLEVREIGVSLRTLVSYFDQRPDEDFKQPVRELLAKGVCFTYVLLDPDCDSAAAYARDNQELQLLKRIRQSVDRLQQLEGEFGREGHAGRFEIVLTTRMPLCHLLLIDPKASNGTAFVSHYLHGLKRADAPVIRITRTTHPILLEKYLRFYDAVVATSRRP